MAGSLARWLASTFPQVEVAGTSVSTEDAQQVRHWVFCDRITPERRRCLLRCDHHGECLPPAEPGG
nr:hypothetical protein [Micromonospora tarapacensis]